MIKQRDICLVDLNPVKGHEQSGLRPVLVIQNNILNNRLPTTIVIPLTGNTKYKYSMLHYFLEKEKTKLDKDSSLILFQIRTIDQDRILKKISFVDVQDFKDIKKRLKNLFIDV
jgi:mRNA interferase MazF